jgi:hypothetical protein
LVVCVDYEDVGSLEVMGYDIYNYGRVGMVDKEGVDWEGCVFHEDEDGEWEYYGDSKGDYVVVSLGEGVFG